MNKYWGAVVIAGILEVVWVSGLTHAANAWEWAGTILSIAISFGVLYVAASKLPIGTVYAVFTGLGTGGTVLAEMFVFGETVSWAKLGLIALLVGGVIGLKLVSEEEEKGDAASCRGSH